MNERTLWQASTKASRAGDAAFDALAATYTGDIATRDLALQAKLEREWRKRRRQADKFLTAWLPAYQRAMRLSEEGTKLEVG